MEKIETLYDFANSLLDVKTVMEKAKVANDALWTSYFSEFGGNNPSIMTEYERASSLQSIVTDYIEQSCKMLDDLMKI